jgi:hypothetical protein
MITAFSGFKQSGKDSSVNFLVEKYGFKRVSFADPLKDAVAKSFYIPRAWLDDTSYKEKPLLQYPTPAADEFTKMISQFMTREFRTADGYLPEAADMRVKDGVLQTFIDGWENLYHTPRSLAILMGSSMRAGDTAFWVKKAIDQIEEYKKQGIKNFAISDLRYQSEAKQLKEAFDKDLTTIRINRFDSSPSADPSELDLVGYQHDFTVTNKGTKEELFSKIDEILNTLV